MDRHVIQDDQHFEQDEHGVIRHQRIYVEERWETIGADGKPYSSEATREDAIYRHVTSNAHLADSVEDLARHGHQSEKSYGEPLRGVRKVMRYETSSTWEVASDFEELDEMTEQLNLPPCPHPPDRAMNSGSRINSYRFCGRCCERLPDEKDKASE